MRLTPAPSAAGYEHQLQQNATSFGSMPFEGDSDFVMAFVECNWSFGLMDCWSAAAYCQAIIPLIHQSISPVLRRAINPAIH
jgi:hypothetical protein